MLICLTGIAAAGEYAKRATMRDAATHEQLAKRSPETTPTVVGPVAPAGSEGTKAWRPESLLARSDFLNFGSLATLVPKGAILHVPPALAARMGRPEGTTIVTWAEFYAANRGWIVTYEVTRAQASGQTPIPGQVLNGMKQGQYLVVATMQAGPISVLPPKQAAGGS
jgi:hypothetical protein